MRSLPEVSLLRFYVQIAVVGRETFVKYLLENRRLICILLLNLVTVSAKAREITVTGPRGSLHRSFKHLAVDIQLVEIDGGKQLKVDLWFGNRETIAAVR